MSSPIAPKPIPSSPMKSAPQSENPMRANAPVADAPRGILSSSWYRLSWAASTITGRAYPDLPRVNGNPFLGIMPRGKGFHGPLAQMWNKAGEGLAQGKAGVAYGWFGHQLVMTFRDPALISQVY